MKHIKLYEAFYVTRLQAASSTDAEIYDVGTLPDNNAISISIAYKPGYGRK